MMMTVSVSTLLNSFPRLTFGLGTTVYVYMITPLDCAQSKAWIRTAMAICDCSTPSELGHKLNPNGTMGAVDRACRAYNSGSESVRKHLKTHNRTVASLTNQSSAESLSLTFMNGPGGLWHFYCLPSEINFNSSLRDLSEHRFPQAVQDWMIALEEYIASFHIEAIIKQKTAVQNARQGPFVIPYPEYRKLFNSPQGFELSRLNLVPLATANLSKAINALHNAAIHADGLAMLTSAELFKSAWSHGWFSVKELYPKHFVRDSMDQFLTYKGIKNICSLMDENQPAKIKSRKGPLEDYLPEIKSLLNQGVRPAEIARRYGRTRQGVSKLMKRHNLICNR